MPGAGPWKARLHKEAAARVDKIWDSIRVVPAAQGSEVSWQSVFWALVPIAGPLMGQQSGRICEFDPEFHVFLRISPLLDAADSLLILISLVFYMSCGLTLRHAAWRVLNFRLATEAELAEMQTNLHRLDTPPTESGVQLGEDEMMPNEVFAESQAAVASLKQNWMKRFVPFVLGTLTQTIKVAAFSGIPWTKTWAAMFFITYVLVELVIQVSGPADYVPIRGADRSRYKRAFYIFEKWRQPVSVALGYAAIIAQMIIVLWASYSADFYFRPRAAVKSGFVGYLVGGVLGLLGGIPAIIILFGSFILPLALMFAVGLVVMLLGQLLLKFLKLVFALPVLRSQNWSSTGRKLVQYMEIKFYYQIFERWQPSPLVIYLKNILQACLIILLTLIYIFFLLSVAILGVGVLAYLEGKVYEMLFQWLIKAAYNSAISISVASVLFFTLNHTLLPLSASLRNPFARLSNIATQKLNLSQRDKRFVREFAFSITFMAWVFTTTALWYGLRFDPRGTERPDWTNVFG